MSVTEDNSGIRKALSLGIMYKTVQFVFSEKNSKKYILEEIVQPAGEDCRLLDIGCGPGNLISFMPETVDYIGFDVNPNYIETAQAANASRAKTDFVLAETSDMFTHANLPDNSVDVAIVHGVFHHVNDGIASEMLDLAAKKLKKGGVMLTLEPLWFQDQSGFRKWLMSKDRGKNIKQEADWKRFYADNASDWAEIQYDIRGDLIRFYDLLVTKLSKK